MTVFSLIAIFTLLNVFFGITGTFWLRIEQRRAETGLRLALGSTHRHIGWLFTSEGWLLLTSVLPLALVVLFNFCYMELPDTNQMDMSAWNFLGDKNIAILARDKNDFPLIKRGIEKQLKDLNATLSDAELDIMEQPDEIVAHVNHIWSNIGPDMTMIYLQYAIALGVILLVPSLNLCGLSNSRMQQRLSELGVRKAFGATRKVLIRQILDENMVLNLLGGILGLLLSYVAVYALRTWLFTNNSNIGASGDFSLTMGALFSPVVFLLAFLFCFIINLLSAGLPAWRASRTSIVNALGGKTH